MHALCAVFARRAAVVVDALGLAFTAADTGATGPEGSGANDARGHGFAVERPDEQGKR